MDLVEKSKKLEKWMEETAEMGDVYIPKDIFDIMKDAVKAFKALDEIDNKLNDIIKSDKRTFVNKDSDAILFFQGIHKAINIVKECTKEVY